MVAFRQPSDIDLILLRERRRRRVTTPYEPSVAEFTAATKITVPQAGNTATMPFVLWPAQGDVLDQMQRDRLLIILKARQLGISWLACANALYECVMKPGQVWLLFSLGQAEANGLVRRVRFMYANHAERERLPALASDNTSELTWTNGSRITSLAATKRAGRSWTASGVVMDEHAFMQYGRDLTDAVEPTINDGGKLFKISSADGNGSEFHQSWQAAEAGQSLYTPVFLPWQANPTRPPDFRDKLLETALDSSSVYREYPENPIEAFTHAAGLIYGGVWSDGPEDGNVTELAEYVEGAGPVYWALDDGYSAGSSTKSAGLNRELGMYAADAHPRVFLLCQHKPDGHLDVFYEDYACLVLSDEHIERVKALPYPAPDFASHGPGSAEIRGRLHAADIPARQSTADVDESIKEMRRGLAADRNTWRRTRVHPRCTQFRKEMAAYRFEPGSEKPIKAFDHGPDALRGLLWTLRGTL